VAHRLKQTDSPSAKRKLGRQEDEADKEDDEDDDLVEIVRMRKAQRMGVRTQDPWAGSKEGRAWAEVFGLQEDIRAYPRCRGGQVVADEVSLLLLEAASGPQTDGSSGWMHRLMRYMR